MNKDFSLIQFLTDIKLTINMLIDFFEGKYKKIPLDTLIAIFIMVLYTLSPVDFVPDLIPIFGLLDDLAVIRIILLYAQDLKAYASWKSLNKDTLT
jgi:uncharacterized membrane protein YkvA (DUF1232 family)